MAAVLSNNRFCSAGPKYSELLCFYPLQRIHITQWAAIAVPHTVVDCNDGRTTKIYLVRACRRTTTTSRNNM